MEPSSRKEIIQLNGITILTVMALIANFLVVGFMYRWHSHELFAAEKIHNFAYKDLLDEEHRLKNEIVEMEGASAWNETAYVKAIGKNVNVEE